MLNFDLLVRKIEDLKSGSIFKLSEIVEDWDKLPHGDRRKAGSDFKKHAERKLALILSVPERGNSIQKYIRN